MSRVSASLAFLFDWDGILLRSEVAKAAGWVLAALHIRGDIQASLLERLADQSQAAEAVDEAMGLLARDYPAELAGVCALAGRSRPGTLVEVRKLLLRSDSPAVDGRLGECRDSIREALILRKSEVISGTLALLRAAHERVPPGLVTQTTRKDVEAQAEVMNIPIHLFRAVECAGDEWYKLLPQTVDRKAVAYAVACARLGCQTSNSIAYEDSDSGLLSAKAMALECIALKEPTSRQQLTLARLVVPDLGQLANREMIEVFATRPAVEAIETVRAMLAK